MNEEELKQEADEYFKSICGDYNEEYERTGKRHYWAGFDIKNAYLVSAEPREKRIAELEAQLESERDLPAIAYIQGAEKQKKKDTDQLTKAKDLLKKWVELYKPKLEGYPITPIQEQTEQFLKDQEEEPCGQ